MTELIDNTEILLGYNKFLELRMRQAIANRKYRASDHGKIKTLEMHRAWIETKKDDMEYKKKTNTKQRERYHIRKNNRIAELSKNDLSLGEIDSQTI